MDLIPIRIYGDPVLREKTRLIERAEINEEFHALVAKMGETMYAANGIGLAANQIGETRRFFVADTDQVEGEGKRNRKKNPEKRQLKAYINPEIVESSDDDEEYFEGCLSIPEVESDVFRPVRVRVQYRTIDWELKDEWFDGLLARVAQHEIDHLDGVLFIDRLAEAARSKLAGQLNQLKRKTAGKA